MILVDANLLVYAHVAQLLAELLAVDGIRADLVPDAHLAAIARGHGLTVMSNDSDFARFPGVRWHNPLAVGS